MGLPDPLLQPEGPDLWASRARLRRVAAAVAALSAGLLLALGIFSAGAEFGRAHPHASAAIGVSLKALNMSEAGHLPEFCYDFPGGNCRVRDCKPVRNATCIAGSCVCQGRSSCAGADGRCYPQRNTLVASGFTLTNKKFPDQRLMMPELVVFGQLKTTNLQSQALFGRDQFNLIKLPGQVRGRTNYFLTTTAYPDYVATIRGAVSSSSFFGAYEASLWDQWGIEDLAVQVCSKGNGDVMIGSPGKTLTEWFYIHHFSWFVYGTAFGDWGSRVVSGWGLGDGAVWTANPPLPALQDC